MVMRDAEAEAPRAAGPMTWIQGADFLFGPAPFFSRSRCALAPYSLIHTTIAKFLYVYTPGVTTVGSMAVFGYSFTCYCGIACTPICHDIYGTCARWIEYDENILVEKVRRLSRERLEELARKISEHWNELYIHRNLCDAYDCQRYRMRANFEFNVKLLRELGVKYVEKSCECGDCYEVVKMLEESVEPAEVVVNNLPDDIYERVFDDP